MDKLGDSLLIDSAIFVQVRAPIEASQRIGNFSSIVDLQDVLGISRTTRIEIDDQELTQRIVLDARRGHVLDLSRARDQLDLFDDEVELVHDDSARRLHAPEPHLDLAVERERLIAVELGRAHVRLQDDLVLGRLYARRQAVVDFFFLDHKYIYRFLDFTLSYPFL